MRAPDFWTDRASPLRHLLMPLACLYAAGGRLHHRITRPKSTGVPVICVGNLVAGGAGKTPVVLALAERLAARLGGGETVHIVTRGYGGSARGPLRVDPARHGADEVGDEALLLAAVAPTWVARDRAAGAKAAEAAGAVVIILDDGFQNPTLRKHLSLLVIDGLYGFGNGQVMPAGPLREPVSHGLARADAVVLIGEDRAGIAAQVVTRPMLRARLVATSPSRERIAGRRVVAFAGIGRPDKFFASLTELGCILAERRAFADHYRFARRDIEEILAAAVRLDALPVTTAKDAMRLPADLRAQLAVLEVAIAWEDEIVLDRLLGETLSIPSA